MGKEKNYIVPAEKKCVLELMTYLTKYLLLEYLFPPKKKDGEDSCFISLKNVLLRFFFFYVADFCK